MMDEISDGERKVKKPDDKEAKTMNDQIKANMQRRLSNPGSHTMGKQLSIFTDQYATCLDKQCRITRLCNQSVSHHSLPSYSCPRISQHPHPHQVEVGAATSQIRRSRSRLKNRLLSISRPEELTSADFKSESFLKKSRSSDIPHVHQPLKPRLPKLTTSRRIDLTEDIQKLQLFLKNFHHRHHIDKPQKCAESNNSNNDSTNESIITAATSTDRHDACNPATIGAEMSDIDDGSSHKYASTGGVYYRSTAISRPPLQCRYQVSAPSRQSPLDPASRDSTLSANTSSASSVQQRSATSPLTTTTPYTATPVATSMSGACLYWNIIAFLVLVIAYLMYSHARLLQAFQGR